MSKPEPGPMDHDEATCVVENCKDCKAKDRLKKEFPKWCELEAHAVPGSDGKIVWACDSSAVSAQVAAVKGTHLDGIWTSGCKLCFNDASQIGKWNKWARFQVQVCKRSDLQHHRDGKGHVAALARHLKLEIAHVLTPSAGRYSSSYYINFGKGVPGMEDYARVFVSIWKSESPQQWRCHAEAERMINGLPRRKYPPSLWKKLVWILEQVQMQRWHRALMRSSDVSISADGASAGSAESVLFLVVDRETLEEVEGSFGVYNKNKRCPIRMKAKPCEKQIAAFEAALQTFATRGLSSDKTFLKGGLFKPEVLQQIKTVSSSVWLDGDKGAQLTGRLLSGKVLNGVACVGRDLMHEIDIIVAKAPESEPEVAALRIAWISQEKSHSKMVTYSDNYCKAFEVAQQEVMDANGGFQVAGTLSSILTSLQYSGVRKISEAESVQGIVLTALASLKVVSGASQIGVKAVAGAAKVALDSWDSPMRPLLFAMYGDYLIMGKGMKDFTEPDKMRHAACPRKAREWKQTMEQAFIKGEIVGPEGANSLTSIMLRQMEQGMVYLCGDKLKVLRGPTSHEIRQALTIMRRVCTMAFALIDICFDPTTLEASMECWDVEQWNDMLRSQIKGKLVEREAANQNEVRLMQLYTTFCRSRQFLELPGSFKHLMNCAASIWKCMPLAERSLPPADKICLKNGYFSTDDHRTEQLKMQLSFFIAFQRRTTNNERFLKIVKRQWTARGRSASLQSIRGVSLLHHFGPQKLTDIMKVEDGSAQPMSFLIEADQLWKEHFGKRCFRVTELRRTKRAKIEGTKKAWRLLHSFAMRSIRKLKGRVGRGNKPSALANTRLGKLRPVLDNRVEMSIDQLAMIRRYAQSKANRDKEQKLRLAGKKNPYEVEAKRRSADDETVMAKAKRQRVAVEKARKAESTVYIPAILDALSLPAGFDRLKSQIHAEILVLESFDQLAAPSPKMCQVTNVVGHTFLCNAAWAAILLGRRVVIPSYFEGDLRCVKYVCPFKAGPRLGIWILPKFEEVHPHYANMIRATTTDYGSKWCLLTDLDVARWEGHLNLKSNVVKVSNLTDLDNFVRNVERVDKLHTKQA